ncbi:MAG TPA: hypothetical protein VNJ04_02950 [Gemmatimonadaceae bacterium]|nr:hypothetical protein [Gemmatimonadaceae bacterium]
MDSNEDSKVLLKGAVSGAAYTAPGYLIFAREQTLMARAFDEANGVLSGETFSIAENVGLVRNQARSQFSVSATGVLAHLSSRAGNSDLLWFDRSGKRLGSLGPAGPYRQIVLSPDEKRVAVDRRGSSQPADLWLVDLATGTPARFTFTPWGESEPVWSPDNTELVFSLEPDNGPTDIYRKPISGASDETRLFGTDGTDDPQDWSPDGRFILYKTFTSKTRYDLWVLPLSGDRQPVAFLQTEADETQGDFSPDGRWVAYASNESGNFEVYVRSFPLSGGKWQVSSAGGAQPKWRHDGAELFYVAPDRTLMAVGVKAGAAFQHGVPHPLFKMGIDNFSSANRYAVASRGERFLVNTPSDTSPTPITIVLNWTADVKR